MSDALGDLEAMLELLERHGFTFADVEFPPVWRWREVPFGLCVRCYWPAHTLGPGGRPIHAFCWGNANSPSRWDQWMLRKWREEQES